MWFLALLAGGVAGFFVGVETAAEGVLQAVQKGDLQLGRPLIEATLQEAVQQGKLPPEVLEAYKRGEFLPSVSAPEVRGWANTRGQYRKRVACAR